MLPHQVIVVRRLIVEEINAVAVPRGPVGQHRHKVLVGPKHFGDPAREDAEEIGGDPVFDPRAVGVVRRVVRQKRQGRAVGPREPQAVDRLIGNPQGRDDILALARGIHLRQVARHLNQVGRLVPGGPRFHQKAPAKDVARLAGGEPGELRRLQTLQRPDNRLDRPGDRPRRVRLDSLGLQLLFARGPDRDFVAAAERRGEVGMGRRDTDPIGGETGLLLDLCLNLIGNVRGKEARVEQSKDKPLSAALQRDRLGVQRIEHLGVIAGIEIPVDVDGELRRRDIDLTGPDPKRPGGIAGIIGAKRPPRNGGRPKQQRRKQKPAENISRHRESPR